MSADEPTEDDLTRLTGGQFGGAARRNAWSIFSRQQQPDHPFTHTTCLRVCTTSTRSAWRAMT